MSLPASTNEEGPFEVESAARGAAEDARGAGAAEAVPDAAEGAAREERAATATDAAFARLERAM